MRQPVNPPSRVVSPLWLERVPPRSGTLVTVILLAAGFLAAVLLATRDGWSALAVVAVVLATAGVAVVVLSASPTLALVLAALAVAVDAAREAGTDPWSGAFGLSLAAALLAGGHVRTSVERRDEELAVAADTVEDLSRRTRLSRALGRGAERSWLQAEVARAERHRYPLTVVLVRADDAAGPETVEATSRLVVATMRGGDTPIAEEDDRVAVVLPYADATGGRIVAERIRLAAASAGDAAPGTVSVGVAEFPADATNARALVRAAERALVRAQVSGGNRTMCVTLPAPAPAGWALAPRHVAATA